MHDEKIDPADEDAACTAFMCIASARDHCPESHPDRAALEAAVLWFQKFTGMEFKRMKAHSEEARAIFASGKASAIHGFSPAKRRGGASN